MSAHIPYEHEEEFIVAELASEILCRCRDLALLDYDNQTDRFKELVPKTNPLLFVYMNLFN